jgi:hypothetical protein
MLSQRLGMVNHAQPIATDVQNGEGIEKRRQRFDIGRKRRRKAGKATYRNDAKHAERRKRMQTNFFQNPDDSANLWPILEQ